MYQLIGFVTFKGQRESFKMLSSRTMFDNSHMTIKIEIESKRSREKFSGRTKKTGKLRDRRKKC